MDITSTKQYIRKHMKMIVSLISQEEKTKKSLLLTDILKDLFKQKAVNTVAFFLPFASEPNVLPALERCQQENMSIVVPHTDRQKNMFVSLEGYEDDESNQNIDIILVPGVAFTQEGKRLGRGGGWYDRVIATWRSKSPDILIVGVCFSQQCIEFLPSEAHDQNMDMVIAL